MPGETSFRDDVARGAVRTVNLLSRLASRGSGTVIGGRVGLAIAPGLLANLARGRDVVLVSGTNGKTTTTAMIAAGWGQKVATNDTGSNMPEGLVAALVSSKSTAVVLEVDEAWLSDVASATRPRVITLLNLSRDQLDRANEVRQIAERWRALLADLGEVTVVANANDPLVVYAAELAANVDWCDVPTPWTTDAVSCPRCTKPLEFAHGSWWSECGFAKPQVLVTTVGGTLIVRGTPLEIDLQLPGAFNEANAAMALTALAYVGVDLGGALDRVNALSSVAGRFSLRRWRGHQLRLLLAKNPAGFTSMLLTLKSDGADVWVAINARVADGRDPSWLYDVPFELLRGHKVYCFGDRRLDLATRLDYANVAYVLVADGSVPPASSGVINVLANYTAFQEWRTRSKAC
ncbi:MAG TPA: MurT ligase domain-containing protein [Acidimicrobiales bacterium]|nr:MurT ligase domain-containing protein [Acidimicrobiales bacterium]